jgi:hypothetical protein
MNQAYASAWHMPCNFRRAEREERNAVGCIQHVRYFELGEGRKDLSGLSLELTARNMVTGEIVTITAPLEVS